MVVTLYVYVLFGISEQTVAFALCIISRLVFIIEFESVYIAVRTGSLNKAVCASSLNG